MSRPLRIAILTHSTNPRGGVVHALELGDALARLGHHTVVHAPDASGTGFFRDTVCRAAPIPASPAGQETRRMVDARIADYLRYFDSAETRNFDVWHAQDGISANALAVLKGRGRIFAFARTVHHLDDFADPALARLQHRSVASADRLLVVSALWRDRIATEYGRQSLIVGNGVDPARYRPETDETDDELRSHLALGAQAPVLLAVGGVEARKNTIRILQAFARAHAHEPQARLVIAGGASLLDHSGYQRAFAEALVGSGLPPASVTVTGPLPQRLMPALYRAASLLLFPSLREGFGLAVLEAMASGLPVVTARTEPFVSYLGADDALWCDPHDVSSIVAAIAEGLRPGGRAALGARGFMRAAAHGWAEVAERHLETYAALLEPAHA